jgi:hypothetical protein
LVGSGWVKSTDARQLAALDRHGLVDARQILSDSVGIFAERLGGIGGFLQRLEPLGLRDHLGALPRHRGFGRVEPARSSAFLARGLLRCRP